MTTDERKKLYDDFHSGVRMMMDKIEKISRAKDSWSLSEMGCLADIMKDLAMTEKNIAKAHKYYSEHTEEVY
jgi:succinylglutamate desuccinylase